ncbi:hypothetical protein FG379_001652 [Cryptosporidium bovis]|uniref:uncharacterized protein n=1 Tax=Cryptosporidium bovis TaxID=310047 RepID=UPI00351A204A|nr:hypothetical protein FG379_001652 [Cryptosporidium bovis]
MRKSLATLMDNLGSTIGIGGTPMRNVKNNIKKSNELYNGCLTGDIGLRSNMIFASPSRPLGLPPPLPYNRERSNIDNTDINSLKSSPSIENTRILTPFNIGTTIIRSQGNDGTNSPVTKSVVKIKSMIQTPKRIEANSLFSNNNNNDIENNLQQISIFTPQSPNKKLCLSSYLEKTPSRYEENNSDNFNVTASNRINNNLNFGSTENLKMVNNSQVFSNTTNKENNVQIMENMEILRRRLNEKSKEIHFLRRTVKDLENRILNFESKEKIMLENELNCKKKLDGLLMEKQDYIEKIRFIQDELIKSKEDNTNIIKENSCLSNENELKNYEIKKLNDEIINLETKYKNNFTMKYLNPIKNILYEFINEIRNKVGEKVLINVDFNNNNMEIDFVIKTLHEYINHLKDAISLKVSEDRCIIEKLHDEISRINADNYELKTIIEEQKLLINNNHHGVSDKSLNDNSVCEDKLSERKSIVNFGIKNFAKSLINYTYSSKNNTDSNDIYECVDNKEVMETRELKKKSNSKDVKKVKKIIKKTDSIKKKQSKTVKSDVNIDNNKKNEDSDKNITRTRKSSNIDADKKNEKSKLKDSIDNVNSKSSKYNKKVTEKHDLDDKGLTKKGSAKKTVVSKTVKPQISAAANTNTKKKTKTRAGSSKS